MSLMHGLNKRIVVGAWAPAHGFIAAGIKNAMKLQIV
jgi:hypothetical protein